MAVKNVNEENFEHEVSKSSKPVVIDFFASWCGPCQMMHPVLEKVSDDFKGKAKFVRISTEENPGLADEFGIRGIPAFVVMNKGKEIGRFLGYVPEEPFAQKVNDIISNL